MNRKEFEQYFKANIENDHSSTDKPALRAAWNQTIDSMIRDGRLPERIALEDKRRQEKALAAMKAKALIELRKWAANKRSDWRSYAHFDLPVKLRASVVPNTENFHKTIETSRGAVVNYDSGKALYDKIRRGQDVRGFNIDGYTVMSLNGVLKIGCHEIERKEIDRFAKSQGWI
jgi:hypothetical protein